MACLGFWPCISLASLADHREALACPSVVAETLYLSTEAALLAMCVRTPPQRAAVLRAAPPSAGGAPAVPAGSHRTVPTGAGRKNTSLPWVAGALACCSLTGGGSSDVEMGRPKV